MASVTGAGGGAGASDAATAEPTAPNVDGAVVEAADAALELPDPRTLTLHREDAAAGGGRGTLFTCIDACSTRVCCGYCRAFFCCCCFAVAYRYCARFT